MHQLMSAKSVIQLEKIDQKIAYSILDRFKLVMLQIAIQLIKTPQLKLKI
jgi:hypothetical protein